MISPHITVRCSKKQVASIDFLARRYGMSRSKFALRLIQEGWKTLPNHDRAEAVASAHSEAA